MDLEGPVGDDRAGDGAGRQRALGVSRSEAGRDACGGGGGAQGGLTGATPVAATNCLNFGNPEKPEIMAQLSAAIDGIAEACIALGTPITGGNVSLYNETKGEGIYPTPVLGIVGILDDVTRGCAGGISASRGYDFAVVADAARRRAESRARSSVHTRAHQSIHHCGAGSESAVSCRQPIDHTRSRCSRGHNGLAVERAGSIWQFGVLPSLYSASCGVLLPRLTSKQSQACTSF